MSTPKLERERKKRLDLRAAGLCGTHTATPVVPGTGYCARCQKDQPQRAKKFRAKARATGGCLYCTNRAVVGRVSCAECAAAAIDNGRVRRYKINKGEYDIRNKQQDGLCACCQQPESTIDKRTKKIRSLAIDHNHGTGSVRALLCCRCNTLGDDINLLFSKIAYLKQFDGETRNERQ